MKRKITFDVMVGAIHNPDFKYPENSMSAPLTVGGVPQTVIVNVSWKEDKNKPDPGGTWMRLAEKELDKEMKRRKVKNYVITYWWWD
jgi:hypothetical protein